MRENKQVFLTILACLALLLFILLMTSAAPYASPPCLWHVPARLDVYEMAEVVTGAPSRILRAIARAESNESDEALGDDGVSVGRFQINERYHRERARLYGEYNPCIALEAARIAGGLYIDNLRELGTEDRAISAHRWGLSGERAHGLDQAYVSRVKANAR